MISARLVGDDTVIAWLRLTPDAIASGLGRVVTKLGINLQRRAQEIEITRQTHAAGIGSSPPNVDLQIEDDGDRIAAKVASVDAEARLDVKDSLRRIKRALNPPISNGVISKRFQLRRTELPRQSFLRSALEDMDPEIREEAEAALRDALTRG